MKSSFFLLTIAGALACASCAPTAATTRPGAAPQGAQVLAAHGYAVPRAQLAEHIAAVLHEGGWTIESTDAEVGVFVARKKQLLEPQFTITVVMKPAGDRLRVDVTSLSTPPQLLDDGLNKRNVWAFYDALDRRAGDPSPPP
jgi:hypothetical protein